MMAFATRYEVTTHVPSSTVDARLPAMWGMETLTTVVSRISMKVASMTDMVTTQGFTWRCRSLSDVGAPESGWIGRRSSTLSYRTKYERMAVTWITEGL